jgi:hypothetical protein
MQSSKVVAFLPYIQTNQEGKTLKDLLIPKLSNLPALETKIAPENNEKVIDAEYTSQE